MSCNQFFWGRVPGQCFSYLIRRMFQLFFVNFLFILMSEKMSFINNLFSLQSFLFYFFYPTNFNFWGNFCQMRLKLSVLYLFVFDLMSNLITWLFCLNQLFGILAYCIKFFYGSFMIHTVKVLVISLRLVMFLIYLSFR